MRLFSRVLNERLDGVLVISGWMILLIRILRLCSVVVLFVIVCVMLFSGVVVFGLRMGLNR